MTQKATATFYPNEDKGEVVIRLDPRNASILRQVLACGSHSLDEDFVLGGQFFKDLTEAVPDKYLNMYYAYDNRSDDGDKPDYTVYANDSEYVSPESEDEEAEAED